MRAGCDGQLHQLLLKIYNSPHISEKISSLFLQLPSHLRRIAIAVFILKGSGLSSDRSILNELLKDAPLIRLSNTDRESVQFLWDDSTGHIRLKSSVLAEYYLTKLADASVVVEILLEMFLQALKLRDQSPEYEYFMRSIMSFSALQKLLPKNDYAAQQLNSMKPFKVQSLQTETLITGFNMLSPDYPLRMTWTKSLHTLNLRTHLPKT